MLAVWAGGAGAVPGTPPPVDTGQPQVGGAIVAGYFSRGKWHDLLKLIEAEKAASTKADDLKRSAAKTALASAAEDAAIIVEAIQSGAGMPDIDPLTAALEAANGATRLADVLSQAKKAARIARHILDEIEEEEEAVAFLLLH